MLRVEGITVSYGNVRALSDLSMEVKQGEIVALIGANGAGKSSTLRTISGLNRPQRGSIIFDGVPIGGKSPSAIVRMGIAHCPEERKIWPMMTVEENLELGAYVCRDKRQTAERLERMFAHFPRLKERRSQLAGTLSGGEQQMLAIGRALMSGPRMLLLDEPSLGLSPVLVQEVERIIRGVHREGVTILLVEQSVQMALGVAQRAYVLESGRNVAEDSSENLLGNPAVLKAYLGG